MAKDVVFKIEVAASIYHPDEMFVEIVGPDGVYELEMSRREWDAFRSGLMPNSRVDFDIQEEK